MRPVTRNNVELSVELDMNALPVDASEVLLRLLQVIHDSYGVNARTAAIIYPPIENQAPGQSPPAIAAFPSRDVLSRAATVRERTVQNRYDVSRNGTANQHPPDLWQQLDIRGRGIATGNPEAAVRRP